MTKQQKPILGLAIFVAFISMAVFLANPAEAGELEPTVPPGATMKTLDEVEPRIPISSLPYTISAPGSYYVTGDLTSAGQGITVIVDDVTIDLMGFSLIGTVSSTGISMAGRSNVEIRNGTVRGFYDGIYESSIDGKEHRVIGVGVVSNGRYGIVLLGEGHLVSDCTAGGNNSIGIYAMDFSMLTGNTAYENGNHGISSRKSGIITGNIAYDNQVDGIYAAEGNTVTGNTAYNNLNEGIVTTGGCTVTGNTVHGNQRHGMMVGQGNTVTGNTAYKNQYSGIMLSAHSLVDQNTAYLNDQSGGGSANISSCLSCTFGMNHAP